MNEEPSSDNPSAIHDIAIIYCTSTAYNGAREMEQLADQEILQVAQATKIGLEINGYNATLVDLQPLEIAGLNKYDWVFNLVETIYGYPLTDHEVAEQMELFGIPFTGSTAKTLKNCLNKSTTKEFLLKNHIPTPAYSVVEPGKSPCQNMKLPAIVKPVHEDGCVGINMDSRVVDEHGLAKKINQIHETYQQAALVEEFIDGRDITVSILGNGNGLEILPISEIIYKGCSEHTHLSFEANWVTGSPEFQMTKSVCPSILQSEVEKQIKSMALSAYRVMGCRDYARIDFRLKADIPYVLEVNPNPCINPDDAGFVNAARCAGYTFSDLVTRILNQSIRHHQFSHRKRAEKVLV